MLLSKVTYNGFVQHISNELKTLHIQSELSSHVEAVCVCVCVCVCVLALTCINGQ